MLLDDRTASCYPVPYDQRTCTFFGMIQHGLDNFVCTTSGGGGANGARKLRVLENFRSI